MRKLAGNGLGGDQWWSPRTRLLARRALFWGPTTSRLPVTRIPSLESLTQRVWRFFSCLLNGRDIVLAGGSGGLGSVAARMLKADGATLVISYCSNKDRADSLSDIAKLVRADITNPQDRANLLKCAPNLYGLVVLTGIPTREPKDWDRSLSVNYTGPIQLAREAAEKMRSNKTKGSIILIDIVYTRVFQAMEGPAAVKDALERIYSWALRTNQIDFEITYSNAWYLLGRHGPDPTIQIHL